MTTIAQAIELAAISGGDPAAFARFLSRAEAAVRRHLGSFAAHVDTEAVVQETFLRVWQVAPRMKLDGKPDPLLRLALRVARNLAVDEVRRTRRVTPEEAEALERRAAEAEDGIEEAPPDPLLRELIRLCLGLLPAQPRRALEARLGARGGVSDAALAEGLGMRKNTFLQNFGRARRLLADCLRSKGADVEAEAT